MDISDWRPHMRVFHSRDDDLPVGERTVGVIRRWVAGEALVAWAVGPPIG